MNKIPCILTCKNKILYQSYFNHRDFLKKGNFLFICEEEINKKINFLNQKHKFIIVTQKVDIDKILKFKIKFKIIIFFDHPFSPNFKNYLKKYQNLIRKKIIFFETYDIYKDMVPNYISIPNKFKKFNFKNTKKNKKFDIIFLSGSVKINFISLLINFQILILFFLLRNNNNFSYKLIKNNFFFYILFKLSFSDTYTKFYLLYSLIKFHKKYKIKKELEKIKDVKIIFCGSKIFKPINSTLSFDWLYKKKNG